MDIEEKKKMLSDIEDALFKKITESSDETAEGVAACTHALLRLWSEYPALWLDDRK